MHADKVDHAGRKSGQFEQLGDFFPDQNSGGSRFEHHGVSGHQGRDYLWERHGKGIVPRTDHGNHPVWQQTILALLVGEEDRLISNAGVFQNLVSAPCQIFGNRQNGHNLRRQRLGHGLALLPGNEFGNLGFLVQDNLDQLLHKGLTFSDRQRSPARKGGRGFGNCRIDSWPADGRHSTEFLSRAWIDGDDVMIGVPQRHDR